MITCGLALEESCEMILFSSTELASLLPRRPAAPLPFLRNLSQRLARTFQYQRIALSRRYEKTKIPVNIANVSKPNITSCLQVENIHIKVAVSVTYQLCNKLYSIEYTKITS